MIPAHNRSLPMQHRHDFPDASRKPTNVSLATALVNEAKALGLNISRACEAGLAAQIAAERERLWKAENATAIADWNAWTDEAPLPLAHHRQV